MSNRYISRSRISAASIHSPVSTSNEIKQPRRPGFVGTPSVVAASTSTLSSVGRIAPLISDTSIQALTDYFYNHDHCVLPESTTVSGIEKIETIGVVAVSYGTNSARVEACMQGLARLDHANPKPGYKVFVEAVEENGQPIFTYLKEKGWDYIQVPYPEKAHNLFQKEMLWTIGARHIFDQPKIDRCVFIDADCAFHDNSWPYIINRDLNSIGFVQPYIGMAYSGQKNPAEIILSAGYLYAMNKKQRLPQPGGAFACTKAFFYEILKGRWPYNPVGSGDVLFWLYMYGYVPGQYLLNCATYVTQKKHPNYRVGYSRLLLNHYYHGTMGDRMYSTRHYVAVRCLTGNETRINEDGLLEWTDTPEGQLMQEAMKRLRKGTDSYVKVGRVFSNKDTKTMLKKVAISQYGVVDTAHPLYITTVYRPGKHTPGQIRKLREDLVKTVQVPFKFVVISDTQEDFKANEIVPLELTEDQCPDRWKFMLAFKKEYEPNASVLYLDPSIQVRGSCLVLPCKDTEFCLARIDGKWDPRIMYFRNVVDIYPTYKTYVTNPGPTNLDYLYSDPVNYLISDMLHRDKVIRDVLFHVDYEKSPSQNDLFNFVVA